MPHGARHRCCRPAGEIELPQAAWTALRSADCLFYRAVTSTSRDAWANVTRSAGVKGATQFLSIVDSAAGLDAPEMMVLACFVFPPPDDPQPSANVVGAAYSETTSEPYTKVTVLPQRITLDIDEVL